MTFKGHIHEKINQAYSVLGIIKRNFEAPHWVCTQCLEPLLKG